MEAGERTALEAPVEAVEARGGLPRLQCAWRGHSGGAAAVGKEPERGRPRTSAHQPQPRWPPAVLQQDASSASRAPYYRSTAKSRAAQQALNGDSWNGLATRDWARARWWLPPPQDSSSSAGGAGAAVRCQTEFVGMAGRSRSGRQLQQLEPGSAEDGCGAEGQRLQHAASAPGGLRPSSGPPSPPQQQQPPRAPGARGLHTAQARIMRLGFVFPGHGG
ncbi:unnamed protein product, partial [Prorocentrum cordatum]